MEVHPGRMELELGVPVGHRRPLLVLGDQAEGRVAGERRILRVGTGLGVDPAAAGHEAARGIVDHHHHTVAGTLTRGIGDRHADRVATRRIVAERSGAGPRAVGLVDRAGGRPGLPVDRASVGVARVRVREIGRQRNRGSGGRFEAEELPVDGRRDVDGRWAVVTPPVKTIRLGEGAVVSPAQPATRAAVPRARQRSSSRRRGTIDALGVAFLDAAGSQRPNVGRPRPRCEVRSRPLTRPPAARPAWSGRVRRVSVEATQSPKVKQSHHQNPGVETGVVELLPFSVPASWLAPTAPVTGGRRAEGAPTGGGPAPS